MQMLFQDRVNHEPVLTSSAAPMAQQQNVSKNLTVSFCFQLDFIIEVNFWSYSI
jgi:hypothetical protein